MTPAKDPQAAIAPASPAAKRRFRTAGWFRKFAETVAHAVASPWAFLVAFGGVLIWALSGPVFKFSQGWQMVVNTTTTIVTLLMVFLLQNTQMRDSRALHLKLDELLRAVKHARTGLVGVETLPDEQLIQLAEELSELGEQQRAADLDAPLSGPSA